MASKNTARMIEQLSAELKPAKPAMHLGSFMLKFSVCVLILYFVGLWLLPTRDSIAHQSTQFYYHFENSLWLAIAYLSAYAAYISSLPGLSSKRLNWAVVILGATLTLSIVTRLPLTTLGDDVVLEMQLWRGWCGAIITIFGLLLSLPLFRWIGSGLLRSRLKTAVLLALGVGSAASFLIQVVCDHGSSMHIYLWHYLPIVILSLVFAGAFKFIFRQ